MIRSELVLAVGAKYSHLARVDVEKVVTIIFREIAAGLAVGRRVELRGFGAFSTRNRDAYSGRNPRTGAEVEVDAKIAVHFRPGKDLRQRLNALQEA